MPVIMRKLPTLEAATVASLLVWAHTVHAHGIAGNRYFDGTLGFDDPAVADEAILPLYNQLNLPHKAAMSARTESIGPSRDC